MERDFLGLNSMEPLAATVKSEISDQENQRSFMKTVSSFPHFSSFRHVTETMKTSAFMQTAEAFDHSKISSMGEIQNFSLSLNNQMTKPSFVGFGQNVADAIIRQQFDGFPKAVSTPTGQVVGFTEPWNSPSNSSSPPPPQMTIFYAGTVSVYEGMSPEKAQAIMLLAGNGSFFGSSKNPPSTQMQSPIIRTPSNVADGIIPKHAEKDEQVAAKTTEISSSPVVIKPEVQRLVPSRGPASMPAMTPSAVPQFRKASLARFLEKRKERVMSAGPYICEKKQPDDINPANDNMASAMRS
ncbi:hypothetical protein V2J09_015102 [Rumex salicifolius]